MNSTASPRGTETNIRAVWRRSEASWTRVSPKAVEESSEFFVGWVRFELRGLFELVKMVFTDPS